MSHRAVRLLDKVPRKDQRGRPQSGHASVLICEEISIGGSLLGG